VQELRRKTAPVYLLAGFTRTFCYGPPPSWAVELVLAPPPKRERRPQQVITNYVAFLQPAFRFAR